jgi:hypothetical protein
MVACVHWNPDQLQRAAPSVGRDATEKHWMYGVVVVLAELLSVVLLVRLCQECQHWRRQCQEPSRRLELLAVLLSLPSWPKASV